MGTNTEKSAEETDAKEVIESIIDNYKMLEESIVKQLALTNPCHGPSTGTSREMIWRQLFENIIPKKFVIEHSIFIIDSHSKKSREIDLAIIDNTYTPYIFQYGSLKFVPIEAVAAVVECKSTSPIDEELERWYESIQCLKTENKSIARIFTGVTIGGKNYPPAKKETPKGTKDDNSGTEQKSESGQKKKSSQHPSQTSTRPIRIFCGYDSNISTDKLKKYFDFILVARKEDNRIEVKIPAGTGLKQWYEELNHHKEENDLSIEELGKEDYSMDKFRVMKGGEEVSLLSLNLQLNQLLMLINNPILFPHLSYAKMFNDVDQKEEKE